MPNITLITLTPTVSVVSYNGNGASLGSITLTSISSANTYFKEKEPLILPEAPSAEYTKIEGYHQDTANYEKWVLRNDTDTTSPSGKTLENVSVVTSWKDK